VVNRSIHTIFLRFAWWWYSVVNDREVVMEEAQNVKDLKMQIVTEISNLSRLLGQIPSDDSTVQEARDSFLKLSILIDQALDLKLC